MRRIDKVIVSNAGRIRAKYRKRGAERVERGIQHLIRADQKRGISTELVYLDDLTRMKAIGAHLVRDAMNRKQNKRSIDEVYAALRPDYLVILGAPDVIPHQRLRNPVGGPGGDDDTTVPSDLPYACDEPYGREIEDFIGPTRAVGRLPNVSGDDDPGCLLSLLRFAAGWRSLSATSFGKGFVISAEVWKGSTRKSASKLFGSSKGLQLSPPRKSPWSSAQLARRVHFINCHGATLDPHYYGEGPLGDYPIAHRSRSLTGIRAGAVAAAECCYGAQLYDPEEIGDEQGICNAYLRKGTHGFFGSTTIAYGPAEENGAADLVCQYFIRNVQRGASIGRAALEARQEFVRKNDPLDPVDLKTIGQFYLLGDPSVHPAKASGNVAKVSPKGLGKALKFESARKSRRRRLTARGGHLVRETTSVLSQPDKTLKRFTKKALKEGAARIALDVGSIRTFDLRAPRGPAGVAKAGGKGPAVPRKRAKGGYHVMIEKTRKGRATTRIPTKRILVAKEENGRITEMREFFPR